MTNNQNTNLYKEVNMHKKLSKKLRMNLQLHTEQTPKDDPQVISMEDIAKMAAQMATESLKTVLEEIVPKSNEAIVESMKGIIDKALEAGEKARVKSYEGIYAGSVTKDLSGNQRTEPGIKLARFMKAKYVSAINDTSIIEAAKSMYSHDSEFLEDFEKQVSVSGDGGYLVPEAYAAEIIPLLYAKTAVVELGARIVPMPNGNLNIPKNIGGTDAQYIGENKAKNAKNPKYVNVKLSAKKLRTKVIVSNDLLRSSAYEADMFIRDDMVQQSKLAMDYAAMFGTGGEYSPKGIKNTANVNKATVGAVPSATNITSPVKAVEGNNANMVSPGWIFNSEFKWLVYNITDGNGNFIYRDEMDKGRLLGFPFIVSNQIPTGTTGKKTTDVFFGDFAEWLIGEQMALELKIFDQASYKDENGNTQSASDNDQTVFQSLMIHDMAASHGEVFAVYNYDTIA